MQSVKNRTKNGLNVNHGGYTNKGLRDENQDAILVKIPDKKTDLLHKGIVACIADGVSCSNHSQKASHAAVVQFINDYYSTPLSWSVPKSAKTVLNSLNTWLYEEGLKRGLSHNGLVTTFTCIIFKSNTAHIFHVGDTRIYKIESQSLKLLTKDHKRINFGKSAHLTRALGMDNQLEVDYQTFALYKDDQFIMSSDGVHEYLNDSELLDYTKTKFYKDHDNTEPTQSISNLDSFCEQLCDYAVKQGSEDNISCIALNIRDLPDTTNYEHQEILLSRSIPPALIVGNLIDHYRVEKIIYQGSRSHVYRVRDMSTNELFAMKVPSLHYSDNNEFLQSFANESWVGQHLHSQRVMKVYPTQQSSKFIYQICELIEGVTLRQWMHDNPRPELQQVREILDELVKAVRVLQRADMVHRDLKPENIMLSIDRTLKIIDLGSVYVAGLDEDNLIATENIPLGDTKYIAPEYIQTGYATSLSDLFSIATIGYEMLSNKLPYKLVSSQDLKSARHTKWSYRDLCNYREDIPRWVGLAFKKALQESPNKRYQALGEFILDLYTPSKTLQLEFKESPLVERNPLLFWKLLAITSSLIAFVELILLL